MKTKVIFIILAVISLHLSGQQTEHLTMSETKIGMVKITIMYPNEQGKTFDMDYYANKHMPMVANLFGTPLKGYGIDKGIAGRTPDELLPYLAIGYFYFDSIEAYNNAFGPNAEKILGDIPNYTNIKPVVLISEVVH
ncbi:EthD family reductase [uncultured Croceitalea sp.]|uniref:EthD family reductase n=1 Tax=uncultured Croceitalea sp. TaxID=1798908 RepID=UPI003306718F